MEVDGRRYYQEVVIYDPKTLEARCRIGFPENFGYFCGMLFASISVYIV
jgi:hypothetical protein